jgi:glutaminyl-tRNA synthetase
MSSPEPSAAHDFIREIVAADVAAGKHGGRVHTRFPPEPNGWLHIGHAKSICLNFGVARDFGGTCNLRFDDTNPTKEDVEYVESITEDVKWLIAGWADDRLGLKPKGATPKAEGADFHLPSVAVPSNVERRTSNTEAFHASDYFAALHDFAVRLIKKGKAYVCDHTPEEVDRMRGAPEKAGKPSDWRERPVAESLDLFARMKAGEFPDGTRTLRAKIDMDSPNVWMRDPVLYRIRHAAHHHTGDAWRIYPMYDFAHCLSDYVEGITHSICTLEFEVHRPLYDWILESLGLPRPLPRQYEFARLNMTHTILSKRKLLRLVEEKRVAGWDDPRMPTIAGMRKRGYPASALRAFCERIGVAKRENTIELGLLEHFVREELNKRALRRFAVLRPLKLVVTNLPEGHVEDLAATNNPEDPAAGTRHVPFGRELWIERDDFMEVPPPKFFRLKPGGEVRLKNAYIVRCDEVIKDASGNVAELRCTADLTSKTGGATANRKVKGTIHWVSAAHALDAEVRLYDTLFTAEDPEAAAAEVSPKPLAKAEDAWLAHLNPRSLEILPDCKLEPSLVKAAPGAPVQFERLGYFVRAADTKNPVFLRTVTLKDTWAKVAKPQAK